MIKRLASSLTTFKTQTFRSGLNILLAEKNAAATQRQTRNSAGKSSIIEVIHFILGSKIEQGSIFRTERLSEASYEMEFDLGGRPIKVRRSPDDPNRIKIVDGDTAHWSIQPGITRDTGETYLHVRDWKVVLGELMFGMREGTNGKIDDDPTVERGRPTFRSAVSYFSRREADGGYREPTTYNKQQSVGNQQVVLSFLLGLDWSIPQQLDAVRERGKELKQLRKAASGGVLTQVIGDQAEVLKELAITEQKANRLKQELSEFHVLAQYRELEAEASDLSVQLQQLADEEVLDGALLKDLDAALQGEAAQAPSFDKLEKLYGEVGVVLPVAISRRYDDVRKFHASVIANRQTYLQGEISVLRKHRDERRVKMEELGARQQQIMAVLKTHGALDQFTQLQTELMRMDGQVDSLRRRHDAMERMERLKTVLDIEKKQLHLRLQQDYQEQGQTIRTAIATFEEVAGSLLENPGSLTIEKTVNGPIFKPKTPGDRGGGIRQMQIFCFDMMLVKLLSERSLGPGFLIHDSHLFDGVDARQTASALKLGSQWAERLGFQYIVTMNSDALPVPADRPAGFDLDRFVLPNRLDDRTESGGLFGFRFD